MFLTKLLTRSRFRDGDGLESISGLERFGFGLNPDMLGDGKGDDEGEENGEDAFFMMPFTELTLSRLRSGEGAGSSSRLEDMVGLEGPPVSGGSAGDGSGEANGDVKVLTRLFTLSRVRKGESECSGGKS